jgi:hypothetical protein
MDIECIRGDTNVYNITVIKANRIVDVSAAKAWFTLKQKKSDADVDALLALDSDINPTQVLLSSGHITVKLLPDDTKLILENAVNYDAQIKETTGDVTTIAEGICSFIKDVTLTDV